MPYRINAREKVEEDLTIPAPGCMCGVSPETKWAMNAVGGWWHNEECLRRRRRRAELRRLKRTKS